LRDLNNDHQNIIWFGGNRMYTYSYVSEDGVYNHSLYVDSNGKPVAKTKEQCPYNYDSFVVWKGDYKKDNYDNNHTVYCDRMWQQDWDKYNKCCREVWGNEGQYFDNRTPESIEKFLSLYYNRPIKLTIIMEGCNWSTGYPVWIFFFEYRN
jgi:hypothetical protein